MGKDNEWMNREWPRFTGSLQSFIRLNVSNSNKSFTYKWMSFLHILDTVIPCCRKQQVMLENLEDPYLAPPGAPKNVFNYIKSGLSSRVLLDQYRVWTRLNFNLYLLKIEEK